MISFHPRVQLELSLDPDLARIKGSPVHLSKTLMNLLSNAAEAMPHGGKINVATGNQPADAGIPIKSEESVDNYIYLKVSDEGVGISEEDQEKIFEPFYTKKVMGRSGTGLGMAVVWGTMEDHSGHIDIHSEVDQGTTFVLYFPATDEQVKHEDPSADLTHMSGQGETILLVDDVKGQREIGSLMLRRLDYEVVTVESGEAAIDYLQGHDVDLVVLDMIMDPGISGLETFKRILAFKPHQRVIIASGYSETGDARTAQALGAGGYLKKPYSLSEIAEAVRHELKRT